MREFWNGVQVAFTAIGGWLGWFLGGCDGLLYALIAFVVIDYITGLMCACKGISTKTESGHISSKAGFDGLIKKAAIILVVLLAVQIDMAIGTNAIAAAAMCFYIANEGVSILENTALLGVPYPAALMNALETMKQKGEEKKDEEKKE